MKYLTFALVLMSFQFASAESLVSSKYRGYANGVIQLKNDNDGTSLLSGTPVDIIVKRVNPLTRPVQFVNGARMITIKNSAESFKFVVPGSAELTNGYASVRAAETEQPADLQIKENRVQTGSKQEVHSESCNYYGYCYSCEEDDKGEEDCGYRMTSGCSGTEKILYRIDTFERSLDLMISDASQAVRIKTQGTPEFENTRLETVASCR